MFFVPSIFRQTHTPKLHGFFLQYGESIMFRHMFQYRLVSSGCKPCVFMPKLRLFAVLPHLSLHVGGGDTGPWRDAQRPKISIRGSPPEVFWDFEMTWNCWDIELVGLFHWTGFFGCVFSVLQEMLMAGWWFGTWLLFFQKYWEFHHPNWLTHIFQRGRVQPPTSWELKDAQFNFSGTLPRWWCPDARGSRGKQMMGWF